jgi:hypothetical protein
MNKNSTYKEILLFTGTHFSSMQYSERNGEETGKQFNERDQLKEACWNGLMPELLPEVFGKDDNTRNLFVWEVREEDSFIGLEMGEAPENIDRYDSIDPYRFYSSLNMN